MKDYAFNIFAYLTLTFCLIRFSYSSSVITPFSIKRSTRLESIVSKRSISSMASLSTFAFFMFSLQLKELHSRGTVSGMNSLIFGIT